MLGPGNPNAAIASMFGTPKGFPPIWKTVHKHRLMKTVLQGHCSRTDPAARCHKRTDGARMYKRTQFSGDKVLQVRSGAAWEEDLLLADFPPQHWPAPAATKL